MRKSYLQQFGIDFNQTFAIVIKSMIFRVLFAMAAFYNLNINQIDIKTALLYRAMNQLLFVKIPMDYYNNYEYMIYRLN